MELRLHYFRDAKGNFGDDLNAWLWDRLAPGCWSEGASTIFTGIGTLIDETIPKADRYIVFSSGVGYGPRPIDFGAANWRIACVRGPLTASVLGLKEEAWITDGAILLASLPEYQKRTTSASGGVIFMPHHKVIEGSQLALACQIAGVEYVSPHDDSLETLEKIANARLVLADAMHAAIVADTLRVPWIPVQSSPEINTFKWLDWTLSMKLSYRPKALPSSSALDFWRSATLPLYGQVFALPQATERAARDHFLTHERARRSGHWNMRRDLGRAVYTRGIRPVLNSPLGRRLAGGYDEKAAHAVANQLRSLATMDGYLSMDTVHAGKLDQMLDRLERTLGSGGAIARAI